jgi:hypothetical protein
MHTIYRVFVFILALIGAGEAQGINIAFSIINKFKDLIHVNTDASHGWIGVLLIILAFLAAFAALSGRLILYGGIVLIVVGVAFFFIVNGWALLASPQLILAGFFGVYYFYDLQTTRRLHGGISTDSSAAAA